MSVRFSRIRRAFARGMVLVLLFSCSARAWADPALVGVDVTTNTLMHIDTSTGVATPIGPTGIVDSICGLTWDSNHDILYGSAYRQGYSDPINVASLVRINPATGATTIIGDMGLPPAMLQMRGIAYDPGQDVLYGQGSGGLWTMNVNTGHATLVAPDDPALQGIAFDPINRLMYASSSDDLATVNLATGATTVTGSFGLGLQATGAGLAFDPSLGLFTIEGPLFQVDTVTGVAALVGHSGWDTVFGAAFVPSDVIPEPGALALVGLASALAMSRQTRKLRNARAARTLA